MHYTNSCDLSLSITFISVQMAQQPASYTKPSLTLRTTRLRKYASSTATTETSVLALISTSYPQRQTPQSPKLTTVQSSIPTTEYKQETSDQWDPLDSFQGNL